MNINIYIKMNGANDKD